MTQMYSAEAQCDFAPCQLVCRQLGQLNFTVKGRTSSRTHHRAKNHFAYGFKL